MQKIIFVLIKNNDNHKQLGLTERIQPSATEIYTSQGIPTGEAMLNYTQTQTIQKRITFDSLEQLRFEEEQDTRLLQLLSYTPDEHRIYFESFQRACVNEIYHHKIELMLWAATTEHYQDASLTQADYDRKIRIEQGKLKAMDEKLPVESYFRHGSDDTAKCGHLLIIKMMEWDDALKIYAVELLSGIQWLIQQKEKLAAATASQKDEEKEDETAINPFEKETTFNEALRILSIDYLKLNQAKTNVKIGEKNWNKMRLVVALMHVLENRKMLPTCDEKAYAKLIAPIISKDSENLRKNINKHQQTIKPYGRNLKELSNNYIKTHPSDNYKAMTSKDFDDYWNGMYELIDGFIDKQEELAPLRAKSAQTPSDL